MGKLNWTSSCWFTASTGNPVSYTCIGWKGKCRCVIHAPEPSPPKQQPRWTRAAASSQGICLQVDQSQLLEWPAQTLAFTAPFWCCRMQLAHQKTKSFSPSEQSQRRPSGSCAPLAAVGKSPLTRWRTWPEISLQKRDVRPLTVSKKHLHAELELQSHLLANLLSPWWERSASPVDTSWAVWSLWHWRRPAFGSQLQRNRRKSWKELQSLF